MSRIGRLPVKLPEKVKVDLQENNFLEVTGPKGQLSFSFHPEIDILIEKNILRVQRKNDNQLQRSLHGLTRTLIANMVEGVTNGFSKILLINGVGYRASKQGNKLALQLGYSHQIEINPPEGITFEVEGTNKVIVKGIDKQQVGQIAANIRGLRGPEPYKGKGIRYEKEWILRKAGKAGKSAK